MPFVGLSEILNFLKASEEKIMFGSTDTICVLKSNNAVLRVNLSSDEFPDYKKIFSRMDEATEILVNKAEFLAALTRTNVMCNPYSPKVKINFKNGVMSLYANQSTGICGEVDDEISTNYKGEAIEAAFDITNLIKAVEMVDEDMVCIGIKNAQNPISICGEKVDDYYCMIVPLEF